MSRATIVLILFAIVIAAIIGLSQFLRSQPPLEITIAVNPLSEEWVNSAAKAFNASDTLVNGTTRVQIKVTSISDMRVWNDNVVWTLNDHPDAWLPASSATVSYVPSNFPFTSVTASTARTPLVWGGFESRVNILTQNGTQSLDWDLIADSVQNNDGNWQSLGGQSGWGFLKLAYPRPSNDVSGLAVLFSGAGHFTQSETLDRSAILDSAFTNWMSAIVDSVPNFQTLGNNPAGTMAARGTSVAEIAILPEVMWLKSMSDLSGSDPISLTYPDTQFILDFPLVMWDDVNTSEEVRQGVAAFGNYLAGTAQSTVSDYGLRPVVSEPDASDKLFAQAVDFGIQLEPDYGRIVSNPDRNTAETLLERFG